MGRRQDPARSAFAHRPPPRPGRLDFLFAPVPPEVPLGRPLPPRAEDPTEVLRAPVPVPVPVPVPAAAPVTPSPRGFKPFAAVRPRDVLPRPLVAAANFSAAVAYGVVAVLSHWVGRG